MRVFKKDLNDKLWNKHSNYIEVQHKNKKKMRVDPYFLQLKDLAKISRNILDCGCGSGAVLEFIRHKNSKITGVDISKLATKIAKKNLKKANANLHTMDLEKLRFQDNTFDLVYSTYVLEHLDKPEKVISEMIRVTKNDGFVVFISPNFGSPLNYSLSVMVKGSNSIYEALKRFVKAHVYLFFGQEGLDWEIIFPRYLETEKYNIDSDAVCAPYLQTLEIFLTGRGVMIEKSDSGLSYAFSEEEEGIPISLKFLKLIKRFGVYLGIKGVSPYKYFGETFYLVGKK